MLNTSSSFPHFMISQVIKAHAKCVRCLCALEDSRFVTGGVEGIISIWCKSPTIEKKESKEETGCADSLSSSCSLSLNSSSVSNSPYNLQRNFYHHSRGLVLCLCASGIKDNGSLCFYSGGEDTSAYRVNSDSAEVVVVYKSLHQGAVCSIKEMTEKNMLLTGSWDGAAGVWNVRTAEILFVLRGHSYAVCVDVLPNGQIITGSQDKTIRFWKDFKEDKIFPGSHRDIIRKFAVLNDLFLSASNDETIKCWDFDGNYLNTLVGHSSFVFDVIEYRGYKGLIASVSEDKTLRIWDLETNTCKQEIMHPATLWQVDQLTNGDLITACEDACVRIWTCDKTRALPLEERQIVENQAKMGIEKIRKEEELDDASFANLPDISEMHMKIGKSKGEVRLFLANKKPVAYEWTGSEWSEIGSVIMNYKPKVFYEGDRFFPSGEYDYVFDVELEDSGQYKKIPYNKGENPLDVAEKFCARENISKYLVTQIVDFLKKNSTAAEEERKDLEESKSLSSSLGRPSKKSFSPLFQVLTFEKSNWDALQNKILSYSDKLPSDSPDRLTDADKIHLKEAISKLKHPDWIKQEFKASEIDVIFRKLSTWNTSEAFPVMDFWRGLALHPASTNLHKGSDDGWRYISVVLKNINLYKGESTNENDLMVLCSLRYLSNLFYYPTNRAAVLRRRNQLLDGISNVVQNIECKPKLTQIAYLTVLTNFAIALGSNKNETKGRAQIMEKLVEFFQKLNENYKEKDEDMEIQCLMAIGTLMHFDSNCCLIFKQLNAVETLNKIKNKSQKINQVIEDINGFLA